MDDVREETGLGMDCERIAVEVAALVDCDKWLSSLVLLTVVWREEYVPRDELELHPEPESIPPMLPLAMELYGYEELL